MKNDRKRSIYGKQIACIILCLFSLFGCTSCAKNRNEEASDCFYAVVMQETRSGKRFGYIDSNGRWAIQPRFEQAGMFYEGKAAVQENGKWGYIDASGAYVIEPQFTWAGRFSENRAPVYLQNAAGETEEWFIDGSGQKCFQMQLGIEDWYADFHSSRLLVYKDGKYGYLDPQGNWAIESQYTQAENFKNGVAVVEQDGDAYKCIDIIGRTILEPRHDYHRIEIIGNVIVTRGNGNKVFDLSGQEIIPQDIQLPKEHFYWLEEGLFVLSSHSKLEDISFDEGCLDEDGRVIIEWKQGRNIDIFKHYILVKDKQEQGWTHCLYDRTGQFLFSVDELLDQNEQLAELKQIYPVCTVELNESCGGPDALLVSFREDSNYDAEGKDVIVEIENRMIRLIVDRLDRYPGWYEPIEDVAYYDGTLIQWNEEKAEAIVLHGQEEKHIKLDPMFTPGKSVVMSYRNDGWHSAGYINWDYHESLCAVRQNGKWGYLDPYGNFAIAPQFDWAGAFHYTDQSMEE